MSRFNHYMNNHFSGCQLIATGFDPHRNREVRVYLMPGNQEDVGLSDGTDAWVAPIIVPGLLKGIDVRELVRSIYSGEKPPVAHGWRPGARKRISLDEPEPAPAPAAPMARKRISLDEPASQPTPIIRRHRVQVL